ncbi:MAG: type I methionyl aminopeptidase [Candidatus Latescibacterota bacterium]
MRRKTAEEIDRIRASCQVVCQVQQALAERVRPGVTTLELDALAEEVIRGHAAFPAFKGYRGFPAAICASVNEEVVHGIPGRRRLREGDIISVDVGVRLDGFYGDGAFTMGVGDIDLLAQHLIRVTQACLDRAVDQARPGRRLSDISHAVQAHAEACGVSVVRQFGGHGIGRALHEDPHINNYGAPGHGPRLCPGLVFALEPILSLGAGQIEVRQDGWTTVTQDRLPAAHCEHTVAITSAGPQILTLPVPIPAAP